MKTKNIFIVEIEILEDAWFVLKDRKPLYTKNQIIMVPVHTSTWYNAREKLENLYSGSEYPLYSIIKITKCNTGFFKPII